MGWKWRGGWGLFSSWVTEPGVLALGKCCLCITSVCAIRAMTNVLNTVSVIVLQASSWSWAKCMSLRLHSVSLILSQCLFFCCISVSLWLPGSSESIRARSGHCGGISLWNLTGRYTVHEHISRLGERRFAQGEGEKHGRHSLWFTSLFRSLLCLSDTTHSLRTSLLEGKSFLSGDLKCQIIITGGDRRTHRLRAVRVTSPAWCSSTPSPASSHDVVDWFHRLQRGEGRSVFVLFTLLLNSNWRENQHTQKSGSLSYHRRK